jgi:hypothetical protein
MALKIRWSVPRLHARPVDRGAAARSDDLCGNAARRGGVRPNICRRWSLAVGAEHIPATRKPVLEVAAPVACRSSRCAVRRRETVASAP